MGQPVVVFTDPEELDVEPGERLLRDAGFEVRVVGSRDPARIAAAAHDAEALIVGYAPWTRPSWTGCPPCACWPRCPQATTWWTPPRPAGAACG